MDMNRRISNDSCFVVSLIVFPARNSGHWLDRVIADTLVGNGSNESNVRVFESKSSYYVTCFKNRYLPGPLGTRGGHDTSRGECTYFSVAQSSPVPSCDVSFAQESATGVNAMRG